ncbi:MAG: carbohydrate porin [Planctomycetota bacterium]
MTVEICHSLFLLAFFAAQVAPAPESPDPSAPHVGEESTSTEDLEPSEPYRLRTTERLTGDWGGTRLWLEEKGVDVSLSLTTIYQQNVHGGVRTRNAHRVSGSYDLELTFDLEKTTGWHGATAYIYGQGGWGDGISELGYVGDMFSVNTDATGDRAIDVLEFWIEQSFLGDKLRVQVGKINLTNEFLTNAYANDETAQFLNYALVVPQQVPIPGDAWGHLGAQAVLSPTDWLYLSAGVADAQADYRETGLNTAFHGEDYFFGIFEFGLTPTLSTTRGNHSGNYRFGVWYDPQPKPKFFDDSDEFAGPIPYKRDDVGFYTSFDQLVFKENRDDDDKQGIGVFLRYGFAHAEVNELEHFWSAGAQYQGLLPTRDEDVIGFGVAQGIVSRFVDRIGEKPRRETVLELYYNVQVTPWLNVSPDLQIILDPGGRGDGSDAFVAGLRIQASF